jgi:U32 family peptidase
MTHLIHPPELLAPAGDWDCARAAVANGADAIYFGLPLFNARLRADNFTQEDLPKLMAYLHRHGVKGYCALNTLVFTRELPAMQECLLLLERAGVDAVIVQDIGVARHVKAVAPALRLHASTQMTITSPEGLEWTRELGIDQAVLARELSLRELERFPRLPDDIPLEVFVHGALCVAYSGQCLTSESLGRRSANRGECAQACRMPYEMIVDDEVRDLGDKRYLLSPSDLAGLDEIPQLIALGIRSFKIEGRLKSPEYVAAVTRAYRKAIDKTLDLTQPAPDQSDWYAMEMTFSRGFYSGWLNGVNHQELVGARFGKKRGPYVGRVAGVGKDWVMVDAMECPLKAGDGIVFDQGGDTNNETGGRVIGVTGSRLHFDSLRTDLRTILQGDIVWKTDDPALRKTLRQTYAVEPEPRHKEGLTLRLEGAIGQPMTLSCPEKDIRIVSTEPLAAAKSLPLSHESAVKQLDKMGGTIWRLESLDFAITDDVFASVSELNQLRRRLVDALDLSQTLPPPQGNPRAIVESLDAIKARRSPVEGESAAATSQLYVLCREEDQLRAAIGAGVDRIYLDFEDIRRYGPVMDECRTIPNRPPIFLAVPRIQKPGEAGIFKLMEKAAPDGILVRNLGALDFFRDRGLALAGDFSLNVANPCSAEWFIDHGLESVTVSCDLNLQQVTDLVEGTPPAWLEIILHQHMAMFHMEHCVFAAFLSNGTDYTNCGRPCEKHRVSLRDRVGVIHPLRADAGCRNTLFHGKAQTGAEFFPQLKASGLRNFRLELLEESHADAWRMISLYRDLLNGTTSGEALRENLRATSQLGVTRGSFSDEGFARKVAAPSIS